MKQYDIFISYRRSSYDIANLIATRLKSAGYNVFFDMEALRSGKFNEQLFEVIDNCKDFVVVLPPNALDRCVNENDWVRLEVCRAMQQKKNIVPVMLNGFEWLNPMPTGMEELRNYQALTATSTEYFDMAMERLQQKYLKSKPHLFLRKWVRGSLAVLISLLTILAIVWGVLYYLSLDVCTKYATSLTKDASGVHMIVEQNEKLKRDWNVFSEIIVREDNPERIMHLQNEMLSSIECVERNIMQNWNVDSVDWDISDYHSFLLSLHGINAEELKVSPTFATMYYKNYLTSDLEKIRMAVMEPSTFNLRITDIYFNVFTHSKNSYYASVLSELSNFPEGSVSTFNELDKLWIYFPKEYLVRADRTYYENIINSEGRKIEELLSGYKSMLNEEDALLDDIQKQADKMENELNEKFEELSKQSGNSTSFHDTSIDEELMLRKEKIAVKEVALKASQAELEELDKQYLQAFESLKKKCTIDESDDQWSKWGKICKWSTYLCTIADSRQKMEKQGIHSTSSITPDIVYAELNSMLSVYQTYHPESKEYVTSVKAFYKEVSRGKRSCAGVLVFGFKDNAVHPTLRVGDIITSYAGKTIQSYDELKTAYKEYGDAKASIIRYQDGLFSEMTLDWEETGIVGLLNLKE